MRARSLILFVALLCTPILFAQRPQVSPGVGNAVLLATNSIQIDRSAVVVSGDVIVNNAASGPVLGEKALSLDQSAITPAGYKLAATSVDLDQSVSVGGDVYFNTLSNSGTIHGAQFTPLGLPVYATLPAVLLRPAGTQNINVPDSGQLTLAEGAYGNVTVGRSATLHLTGGGYAFASITVGRSGGLRCGGPTDVVVSGRLELGASAVVGPENGSGLTPAAIRIQVDGINGSNGGMLSTPPAAHAGQSAQVSATLYATAGSLVLDQSFIGNGAFFGRDIHAGQSSRFSINSAFNAAPTANPQSVSTAGAAPLTIALTGSDPEGSALVFSIVSPPATGALSAVTATSPSSANVTYTPAAAGVPASFTFRVTDPGGATGDAVVTINATETDPPGPNPTTVLATDSSAETAKNVPATLLLRGTAPAGVALTFSIVASTGPSHGSLGAVTQGSEVPERSATVVYTPDPDYVGADSFQFQACGMIGTVTVCDTALFAISVEVVVVEPPSIAHDVETSTSPDTSVAISLGESSIQTAGHRYLLAPQAATLDPVEIAGNVADANGDHLGDNVNALPGPTPVFMSAGVNQAGSSGSGGTVRMQFEWDMSSIAGSASALQSAQVVLPTHRGTVDSLDTFFYWVGVSGDGNLTNSDFEAPAEQVPGAVMSVPPSMPVGGDGTFSFGVLDQVRASASNGFSFFAIQGRVDESQNGPARGLEVRTTASGNVSTSDVPMLSLATPGVTQSLLYTITALPANGQLRDASNQLITTVPYDLPSPLVSYTPNSGFIGLDTFIFSVSNGVISSSAAGRIGVFLPDCRTNVKGCDNGR